MSVVPLRATTAVVARTWRPSRLRGSDDPFANPNVAAMPGEHLNREDAKSAKLERYRELTQLCSRTVIRGGWLARATGRGQPRAPPRGERTFVWLPPSGYDGSFYRSESGSLLVSAEALTVISKRCIAAALETQTCLPLTHGGP